MNAIAPVSVATLSFAEVKQLAVDIARSGLFGIKTPEQAVALMMIAQAEGRHPALAARDYDIIQGRPAKKSEAMHRDFFQAGGTIKWHNLTDDEADATFSHPQGGDVRITWDHKRAAQAGLGGKGNWKTYPRQMLRSRCISEGVRTVWPMATSGMYEPGEVAEFTGTTIEAEPPKVESARDAINREVPLDAPKPQKLTISQWLDSIEIALRDAQTPEEINKVLDRAELLEAPNLLKGAALDRFLAIRQAARDRAAPFPPLEEDEEETVDADGVPA